MNTGKPWMRPWNLDITSFDNMDRDNRFFSVVFRGLLNWLDTNIKMYNKPVRHFIVQTGKEYLYQEANGYNFSWNETTGEDTIYMQKPRCTVTWEEIEIETLDISSPFARGQYERYVQVSDELLGDTVEVQGFSACIKMLPIKMPITLRYVLSNFNECLILTEELLSFFSFTRYFAVSYLGQKIDCSIEFPTSLTPVSQIKVDYSAEQKSRIIEVKIDVKTMFPIMQEPTEVGINNVIQTWYLNVKALHPQTKKITDTVLSSSNDIKHQPSAEADI